MKIEFYADHLHSLKEKRQLISSLKDRLRHHWNISVAETGFLDSWQRAEITIASVSNAKPVLENTFQQIEIHLNDQFSMRPVSVECEYY